ncbi:MAG: hypothetical protein ACRC6I_22050, partial [Paracoccaceae bacterium]
PSTSPPPRGEGPGVGGHPRRLTIRACLAAFCAALAAPAAAETTWSIELEAARTSGADTATTIDLYPSLSFAVPLTQGWTLDIEAYPELYAERTGNRLALTDPYFNLILTARPEVGTAFGFDLSGTWSKGDDQWIDGTLAAFATGGWGRLDLGQTASALGEYCLTPDTGTLDDIALASACPSDDQRGTLRFTTPDRPLIAAVSLARHNGSRAISAALNHTHTTARITRTLGIATATSDVDGTRSRTLQAGATWDAPAWSFGIAGAHTATTGPDPWGLQGAVTAHLPRNIDVTLALGTGQLTEEDGGGRERSAGLTLAWQPRPDHLTLTAGVARRWLSGDRSPESRVAAGLVITH